MSILNLLLDIVNKLHMNPDFHLPKNIKINVVTVAKSSGKLSFKMAKRTINLTRE